MITVQPFQGLRPSVAERYLNNNEAQIANNCDLRSGELRPGFADLQVYDVTIPTEGHVFYNGREFWIDETGAYQRDFSGTYEMGVPRPIAAPAVAVTNAGTDAVFYATTLVNRWGEEGDISDPSEIILVDENSTVNLTFDNGAITEWYKHGVVKRRVYRSSGNDLFFVTELDIADDTFTDDIGETVLAESYNDTYEADLPPYNAKGLHKLANDVFATWTDDGQVFLTEPGLPNAWAHFFPVDSNVVTLSSYDNTLVILTDDHPEIALCIDPAVAVPTVLTYDKPCKSAGSVQQGLGGVIYTTTDGLFFIGRSSGRSLTEGHFDRRSWPFISDSSFYDDIYYGLTKDGLLKIDFSNGLEITFRDRPKDAVTMDGEYYQTADGSVYQIGGSSRRLTYKWRSKCFSGGTPYTLTSRRVLTCEEYDIDYYALNMQFPPFSDAAAINDAPCGINGDNESPYTINGSSDPDRYFVIAKGTTLRVYADHKLVHEEVLGIDSTVDRLTYFERAREIEFELEGDIWITQASLAQSNATLGS